MNFSGLLRGFHSRYNWYVHLKPSLRAAFIEHPVYSPTALSDIKGIKKFGREFLTTFPVISLTGKKRMDFVCSVTPTYGESPVAVALFARQHSGDSATHLIKIGEAPVLFENGVVKVETVQGCEGALKYIDRFRTLHNKSWGTFIFEQIEQHARKLGFNQIWLSAPERIRSYANPVRGRGRVADKERKVGDIKLAIRKRLNGIASDFNMVRQGDFFVKNL